MRFFTVSDIHIDYPENRRWLESLSAADHREDCLLLAGDVSHTLANLEFCFRTVSDRFRRVYFTPGNHDLWKSRDFEGDSLEKFEKVLTMAADFGIRTESGAESGIFIHVLHAWYDFSFGTPSEELRRRWSDFRQCSWPDGWQEKQILREMILRSRLEPVTAEKSVLMCHYMPRLDILPPWLRQPYFFAPVLGARVLDTWREKLKPDVFIYGHSHVNVRKKRENTLFLNNAFGYPSEGGYTRKKLFRVF